MQRILTTLTAATVLALALTAEANAGHHTQHIQQHNDNHISTSNNRHSIMHHDRSDRQIHRSPRRSPCSVPPVGLPRLPLLLLVSRLRHLHFLVSFGRLLVLLVRLPGLLSAV